MARPALVLSSALAIALLVAPAFARAQAQWDQAKVTALAEQLAASLNELEDSARKDPVLPTGSMRKAQFDAREDLRQYTDTIERLARSLKAGASREETLPTYRHAEQHRRDAAESARRADIAAGTQAKIEASRAILAQLAPYYTDVASQ